MSTKTTFKRIALVAVASLGLGVLASAPSSAAQSVAQTYIFCSNADGGAIANTSTTGAECSGVAGSSNFVTITAVSQAKDIEVTGATFSTPGSNWTLNTAATVANLPGGNATAIRVLTPTAGTITLTVKAATAGSGIYAATTETVVITVGAAALSGTYSAANTTAYIAAGETSTAAAGAALSADATISAVKSVVADTATASIIVKYVDGLSLPIKNDTLTATITSGPGTLATSINAATGQWDSTTVRSATGTVGASTGLVAVNNQYSVSARADNNGNVGFFLFANNLPGTTTITIKNSAGTVIATKTALFTDTVIATIEATVLKPTINGDTAEHTVDAIKLVFKDAAGGVITAPSAYPTVVSGTPTTGGASQLNSGVGDTATATGGFVLWGVDSFAKKYGDVVYTFTAGLVTATATVKFVSKVATTLDIAASTATAGDKITYTITAKDSTGQNIPEGSLLSNYVKSVATTGGIATEVDVTTANKSVAGKWTVTGVAPLISTTLTSTFTLTGTAATADTNLVAALAGTTKVVSVSVSNPGIDAAAAAAEEATAAANDATDAALSAAEAAEAATAMAQEAVDAVAELSASVTKLISALRAQITTLTNLVVKIQKKVRA
jgi:hypothetical protein